MSDELIEEFDEVILKIKNLAKFYSQSAEEKMKLQGLVMAMENDHKKATRMIAEYEKMTRERERLKTKARDLLEKLEKLKI